VVDAHVLELRKGLEHLGPDDRLDVGRIARAVDHAPAVEQPALGRQAEVVEHEVAVLHAVVLRQQLAGERAQRFGGHHLRAAGHRAAEQCRLQLADVGVAGHDRKARAHLAFGGVDEGGVAPLDAGDGAVLEDAAAQRLEGHGLALGEAQGVEVAARGVDEQRAVAVGGDDVPHGLAFDDLQPRVAVGLPQSLVVAQLAAWRAVMAAKTPPSFSWQSMPCCATFSRSTRAPSKAMAASGRATSSP
jgi:hypothetical protein